ncbi:MAG: hypothetical protein LIP01_00030, partial [Tannerellaceae bacterium]|nr:hypothetical protein [Tannerellaceae bacterium]
ITMQITVLTLLTTLLFPIQENIKYQYGPSGKILQKTEYTDGKKTGKEIFYYLDGRVKKEISWYDDVLDGYTVSYDSLTNEESGRAYYIFGLPDDVHVECINGISGIYEIHTEYRYGEIKSVTTMGPGFYTYTPYKYINGKPVKHGREKTFQNGKPVEIFHKNGIPTRTEILSQDSLHSGQIYYTDEGLIRNRYYYIHTQEDGRHAYKTEHYEGGKLSSIVFTPGDGSEEHHLYENGEDTGIRRFYRSCELVEEITPDEKKTFYPDGCIKTRSILTGGEWQLVEEFEDTDCRGLLSQGWPMYNFNQITSVKQKINDKTIPIYRLKETGELLNGRYWIFRCPVYAEASYKDGKQHGLETIYNYDGTVRTILLYEEGLKMSEANYYDNQRIKREMLREGIYDIETNYIVRMVHL